MSTGHHANATPAALIRCFSATRFAGYLTAVDGDPPAAVALYLWNTHASGAMWETMGHLEVALRNALADRLSQRHTHARKTGSWLTDPHRELDDNARADIAKARQRVATKHKPHNDGQMISELAFGFWRFLLARRYATTLWPDLAAAFPHAPTRARRTLEQPIGRLHGFRNRLAHHERVWTQPLGARYTDVLTVLGYIDPDVATWVDHTSRVPALLTTCPINRPFP
ncbi:MAG: Abi family protein [Actinobacteria bacterium]|nr:Abi family protein [Actinomycetota bacterium]